MEEKQYKQLCQACDSILLDPTASLERQALPWLHVIREHPVLLKEYEILFEDGPISKHISSFSVKLILGNFKRLINTLFKPINWWAFSGNRAHKTDILFVSHLLNDSQAGLEKDFYFGDLPSMLHEEGFNSAIALVNHTETAGDDLIKKWDDVRTPRYILSGVLGFKEELKFYLKSLAEAARLVNLSKNDSPSLNEKIALKAAYELKQGRSIPNLRMSQQIKKLVSELQPRLIVTTYEGHAWERIVFAEARSVARDITCIGYQHAAIFRLQHAIRRNLSERYNPDVILTSGKAGYQQLSMSPALNAKFSILGSDRGLINYQPIGCEALSCLVIPEGFLSECVLLFNFSIDCAKACPEIKFIWRLHPLISFDDIRKEISLQTLPANIMLSEASMPEDISKCKWTLYRGSTAVVQAIASELIPMYYDDGNMIIDPLYEADNMELYVKNVDQFQKIVTKGKEFLLQNVVKNVREYASIFFAPFDHTVLVRQMNVDKD